MEKIIRETVVTEGNGIAQTTVAPVENEATSFQTVQYLIYFFFGTLDILLVSRFILKLFGANITNGFVEVIYAITGIFVTPFAGIFHNGVSEGIETSSIFEPATLIAILVYLGLAWGIVKLVQIISGRVQAE